MTVAQLKETLAARGLPTDGKKADLVARLDAAGELDDESDSADKAAPAAASADTTEAAAPADAPTEAPEAAAPAENGEPAAEPAAEEPAAEAEPKKEKPKPLTPEERKQMAVDLLTKKIKRAEKFGDEALATAAKKDLARVEKFGVDAGTALAKEIGQLNRSVNNSLADRPKKSKNRVQKN